MGSDSPSSPCLRGRFCWGFLPRRPTAAQGSAVMITLRGDQMFTQQVEASFGYIESLRESLPPLHPVSQRAIRDWLGEMYLAADGGNMEEFARLAKRVQEEAGQAHGDER